MIAAQRAYTDRVERETGSFVPFVFHRSGKPTVTIRKQWLAACKRAGLEWKLTTTYADRAPAILNAPRYHVGVDGTDGTSHAERVRSICYRDGSRSRGRCGAPRDSSRDEASLARQRHFDRISPEPQRKPAQNARQANSTVPVSSATSFVSLACLKLGRVESNHRSPD